MPLFYRPMNLKSNSWWPYWGQFGQFAVVGCIATAVQYLVLIVFFQLFQISPQSASAVGFACGAAVSYLLNRQWTFRSTGPHRRLVMRFTLMALGGLCLNSAVMYLGIRILGLYYLFAQCLATLVTLAMNFLVARIWVFRP
jgi:putative flippase GtrA